MFKTDLKKFVINNLDNILLIHCLLTRYDELINNIVDSIATQLFET